MILTLIAFVAALVVPPQTADPFLADAVRAADTTTRPNVQIEQLPSYLNSILAVAEGQFRLEFIVERDGSVKETRIATGVVQTHRQLAADTIKDLRRWKFRPGEKDGHTVRVLASMTVTFARGQLPGRGAVREGVIATMSLDGIDDDFLAPGLAHYKNPQRGLVMPKVKKDVRPNYPVSGNKTVSVELEGVVLATGKVGAIRVARSDDDRFNDEAIKSARAWEFTPATKDGTPVPMVVGIVLEFRRR